MKNRIRLLASLLIVIFVISLCPISSNAASGAPLRYGRTILSQMNNSKSLLFAYDNMVTGCAEVTESISTFSAAQGCHITLDELEIVYTAFYCDYPEYFWLDTTGYSYKIDSNTGYIHTIVPKYYFSASELPTKKMSFQTNVNGLIQDLNGKSNYEKSLILHDRLAEHVTYNFGSYNQSAYSAIVNGVSVCAGYAKAYQHLLNTVGIPAWYVIGESINNKTNQTEKHAWNLVSIDGSWYYSDVTWDDQGENIFHAFFNQTSENINSDHFPTKFVPYLPVATATSANYFSKNGLILDSLDNTKMAKKLKDGNLSTSFYINIPLSDFKANLTSSEFSRALLSEIGAPLNSSYGYSYVTLGKEVKLTIKVNIPGHVHTLTKVPAKSASCTENGNITYYTCSCGRWFLDSSGLVETNAAGVTTLKYDHSPSSSYSSDNNSHWKVCKDCGETITSTISLHVDYNGDSRCDHCSYILNKQTETTETTPQTPGTTNKPPNTQNDTPNDTPNDTQNDPTTGKPDAPSETPDTPNDTPDNNTDNTKSTSKSKTKDTEYELDSEFNIEVSTVFLIIAALLTICGVTCITIAIVTKNKKK